MSRLKWFPLIVALLIFITTPLWAQTGKIRGTVTDIVSGDPIIGASVVIDGTSQGAAADLNGMFVILAIRPGTYDVRASAVGYADVTIKDVKVTADWAVELKFEMTASSVQLEEVILIYEKPIVDKSATSNVTRYSTEDLEFFPDASRMSSMMFSGASGMGVPGTPGYRYHPQPWPQQHEEYTEWDANPWTSTLTQPLSTFSVDVDNASYTRTRKFIENGQLPPAEAVRIEEFINYFDYDYGQPKGDDPFSITLEVGDCPWAKDHDLLHIGLQGLEIEQDEMPPANFVFLLDVSGSMNQPDKLPLLKKGMLLLVDQLRPQDRVAIVTYAGNAGLVLPSTSGDETATIRKSIEQLRSGGSTAGAAGINLAYKIAKENFRPDGNNRVILATDGDFNVGVATNQGLEDLIEEKRKDQIFLTVLGFGTGNIMDNKMETLADKGNGAYYYVDTIVEAKKVLIEEMGGLYTIAKDVKLQLEFNPLKVAKYRLIGYENRLLNEEDFADDTKDAGEIGSGHTVTALYELIPISDEEEIEQTLRYQESKPTEIATAGDELVTVSFRYKQPDEDESKLLVVHGDADVHKLRKTSDNFRFSAAVAEFGLLLRDSDEKGDANFDQVIALARDAKGEDDNGTRSEFIQLVETAKLLASPVIADIDGE
jgi:Ca-activated chloride channel homolog